MNTELIELEWSLERELRVFAEDVIIWHKGEIDPEAGHPDNIIPMIADKIRMKLSFEPIPPAKSLQDKGLELANMVLDHFGCRLREELLVKPDLNALAVKASEVIKEAQFKTPPVQEDQDELWRDVLRGTKKGSMEDIIENWKSKYTIVPKQ